MNDNLLKNNGGGIYFDELLERIRDIRSSEKVFWRKVLDIYASSVDYDHLSDIHFVKSSNDPSDIDKDLRDAKDLQPWELLMKRIVWTQLGDVTGNGREGINCLEQVMGTND